MQLKMIFPGYLCVKIEGEHCQKVLSMCSFRNISLCDVACDELENSNKSTTLDKTSLKKLKTEKKKSKATTAKRKKRYKKNHKYKIVKKGSDKKAEKTSIPQTQETSLQNICAEHLSKDTCKCTPEITDKISGYSFKVPWKQYQELVVLCEKTNSQITIQSRHGCLWLVNQMKLHLSFLIGVIFCLFLLLFFQTRIWDIQVSGNVYYDSPVLIDYLKTQNITPGINKNSVSCIELADQIRQEFPKIKWTSVELRGCNLIVHLKENLHLGNTEDNQEPDDTTVANNMKDIPISDSEKSYDLIAEKNGTIHSIYVRSGIANVKEGDTCKKGDILVKGQIPIYNDSQEIVHYNYVEADADVIIQYDYFYFDEIDRNVVKNELVDTSKQYYFQLGNYYFSPIMLFQNQNIKNQSTENRSDTKETTKEQLKESKQLKITPALTLPYYWGTITTYEYEPVSQLLTESKTKEQLNENFSYFCDDLEKKGVQIYENNVKMYISDAKGKASGKLTIFEKIGAKQIHVSGKADADAENTQETEIQNEISDR